MVKGTVAVFVSYLIILSLLLHSLHWPCIFLEVKIHYHRKLPDVYEMHYREDIRIWGTLLNTAWPTNHTPQ